MFCKDHGGLRNEAVTPMGLWGDIFTALVAAQRHLFKITIVPFTDIPAHEVRMRRQEAFANITSSLVGGLVLSYLLFVGYVMTIAQGSHNEPTRTSAMGCFSFGHCPVTGIRKN